jgi:nucleoside-diphosphate-sugar epimerase
MKMERLLIVGCGDIARRAIPLLTAHYVVQALVRDPAQRRPLLRQGVKPITGDLDKPWTLAKLAGYAGVILHFAPPPATGNSDTRTANLVRALSRAAILPWRLVYLSTSGVYGDHGGARIGESAALLPNTDRAKRRLDAESRLMRWGRAHSVKVSVLRVPGIYAADRLPLARIREGTPVLNENDDVYTNHIHADDLARVAVAAIGHGRPGRTYNVCDDSEIKMGDWFDLVADSFNLPRPQRISRSAAQRAISPQLLSFMSESRRLDNARMKRELGVILRYPTVAAGLAAAASQARQ